jgi:predicted MFS family arabinose efflux permease
MQSHDQRTKLLGIYGVFTYPFACIPYLYFYFSDQGIGIGQYLQMIAWYYWAMVATEVPTGLLADRFGRKIALCSGSTTLATGFLLLYQGTSYTDFCIGQIVLGVGHALLSGAPTAMLFDSLKEAGKEDRFLQTESWVHSMRLFGTAGAFLVGGGMAYLFGIQPTILLTAFFCLAGGVIAIFIQEPSRKSETGDHPKLLWTAIQDLKSPQLIWILVYFIGLFGLLRFAFHTYQPFFQETVFDHDHPELNWLWLGCLFAALNLVAAPSSRMVPFLTSRFSYRTLFLLLPLALSLAFIAMSQLNGWPAVMLFFVHQIPFGLHWALIQDYVNHRLAASARATTLSILSFAGRVSFALWIPIAGSYQNEHGTSATYLALGGIGIVLTVLWCGPGLGSRLLKPSSQGPTDQ